MPRAENVIDLRADNVDGELSLEEQLLDKSDALGIDEDEAEDIADELEEELEKKSEEMLERLEELDEEAVKSLIESVEDKDEQRDVLAYLSQHKNASLFSNLAKNIFKKKPAPSESSLRREEDKKEKQKLVKLQKSFRKRFFKEAFSSLVQLHKRSWKAQEAEIKDLLKEVADLLDDQREMLKERGNVDEAKLVLKFKTEELVPIYSRINLLSKKFMYTLTILKKAKNAEHSPNRMLFKDPRVKTGAVDDDEVDIFGVNQRYQTVLENKGFSPDGTTTKMTPEEVTEALEEQQEVLLTLLEDLQKSLSASEIKKEINRYVAKPLNDLVEEFSRQMDLGEEFTPTIDTVDTFNRIASIAKELLSIDQAIDGLGHKYIALVNLEGLEEPEEPKEEQASPDYAEPEEDNLTPSDEGDRDEDTFGTPPASTAPEGIKPRPPISVEELQKSFDERKKLQELTEELFTEDPGNLPWNDYYFLYKKVESLPLIVPSRSRSSLVALEYLLSSIEQSLRDVGLTPDQVETAIKRNVSTTIKETVDELIEDKRKNYTKPAPESSADPSENEAEPSKIHGLTPEQIESIVEKSMQQTPDSSPTLFKRTDGNQELFESFLGIHAGTEKKEMREYIRKMFPKNEEVDFEKTISKLKEQYEKSEETSVSDNDTSSDEDNIDSVDKAIDAYLGSVDNPYLKEKYRNYLGLVRNKVDPERHSLSKYIELIAEVDSDLGKYELTISSLNIYPKDLPIKLLDISATKEELPKKNETAIEHIGYHFDDPDDTELLYLNKTLEEVPKKEAAFAYVPIDVNTGYVFPANPNAPLKEVIKDSSLEDVFQNWYKSIAKIALGNATTSIKGLMEYKKNKYSLLPKLEFNQLKLKPRSVLPEHTASFRARKIALAYLYANR